MPLTLPVGPAASFVPGAEGSVLQLSMRRVHDLVAFCAPYELEDVAREVTGADRLEITRYDLVELARRVYKMGRLAMRSRRLARLLVPGLAEPELRREYELFLPVFNNAFELFGLAAVPDWRARARKAVCLICEMWLNDIPEYLLELLSDFDQVFIAVQNPVPEVARLVGKPCEYLPYAADVLRFSPWPDPPPRSIDVCNLGRRSAVTHGALLALAGARKLHYYYDTVRASGPGGKQLTFHVGNAAEHRMLLASLLQRSRYFVAYRARVNEPEQTEGREEISGRFYEGIAAGAVLLGEPPRSAEFARQFDWPDAVLPLPFDSPDVGEVLARLDADPERIARASRNNVAHAASRHDWLHRLERVFRSVGIEPSPGMRARGTALERIAAQALGGGAAATRLAGG